MIGSTHGFSAPTRRIRAIAAIAFQLALLAIVAPMSARAASPSCPPHDKHCLMIDEPPVPGVYKFKPGPSGPDVGLPGRLTIVKKTATRYAVSHFRIRLGQKEGCTLNGRLATVQGAFPLRKKTKVIAFDNGNKEISTSYRLPKTKVRIKVGGKSYPGSLFAAFIGVAPGFGLQPGITGNLRLMTQEGTVCRGLFFGEHRGKA